MFAAEDEGRTAVLLVASPRALMGFAGGGSSWLTKPSVPASITAEICFLHMDHLLSSKSTLLRGENQAERQLTVMECSLAFPVLKHTERERERLDFRCTGNAAGTQF